MDPLMLPGKQTSSNGSTDSREPAAETADKSPDRNGDLAHEATEQLLGTPAPAAPVSPEADEGLAPVAEQEHAALKADSRKVTGDHRKVGTPVEAPASAKKPIAVPPLLELKPAVPSPAVLALFCFAPPDSPVGQYMGHVARGLAQRNNVVHLFTRLAFPVDEPGLTVHTIGAVADEDNPLGAVEDFTSRTANAFGKLFPTGKAPDALLGCDWSTIPVLQMLREHTQRDMYLLLGSLEQQRSDVSSDASQRIAAIESAGLHDTKGILVYDQAAGEKARLSQPECSTRLHAAPQPFPVERFESIKDPGKIKAHYQVGPIDPTILYIGPMDDRHGPDILMKSVPAVLKNIPQARFIFVGDGDLLWPLRVWSRYLNMDGVVRLVGHQEGQGLYELIQAADMIMVPSRAPTEWWPFQAAWAARRPVVATHNLGASVLEHNKNCLLIYPHESSCVWGIECVLFDQELRDKIKKQGRETLDKRFGWTGVAEQIERLLGIQRPA